MLLLTKRMLRAEMKKLLDEKEDEMNKKLDVKSQNQNMLLQFENMQEKKKIIWLKSLLIFIHPVDLLSVERGSWEL